MPLLGDILKGNPPTPQGQPSPEMDMGGGQNIGKVLCAIASKLMEISLPIFGTNSEEGKRIERAIKAISIVHKEIKPEDIGAMMQMVQSALSSGQVPSGAVGQQLGMPPMPPPQQGAMGGVPQMPGGQPTPQPQAAQGVGLGAMLGV